MASAGISDPAWICPTRTPWWGAMSIDEGKLLIDEVRKHEKVFQTSTEDRSLPMCHCMAELVRNGRIGKPRKIPPMRDPWTLG